MDLRPSLTIPIRRHQEQAVYDCFAAQVEKTPEALAVIDHKSQIDYVGLKRSIDHLSRCLVDCGVAPCDRIAIWAERSATLPIAILAALKLGVAFVILDPQYPALRLAAMLKLSRARALLTLSEGAKISEAVLASYAPDVILPVKIVADNDVHLGHADPIHVDAPAYIAFTSGTTGEPKGIIGSQAPLSHFFRWYIGACGFGRHDRFLLLSGLSHDPVLRDILTPLLSGGRLVVPQQEFVRDPDALRSLIVEEGVTVLHLTPSMAELLCHSRQTAIAHRQIPSLRWAFFAGENLKYATVERFRQLAPLASCVNFYGATETPQAMGYYIIEAEIQDRQASVAVGRGIADVQLLVLRTDRQEAAIGELGEICVRTGYLTQGYINPGHADKQRFINNPTNNDLQDRIYCTGDLGFYRADGAIEIRGRSDRQIKLRGFRIELDEIQAAILAHNQVKQAFVELNGDRILAYVIVHDQSNVSTKKLRDDLCSTLPEFMVPAEIFVLDYLPMTANGKVASQQLSNLANEKIQKNFSVDALDELSGRLAQVWADVLGVPRVGPKDSFFDLGGDSLKGLELLLRVEKIFGRSLPVHSLLKDATPVRMAELIRNEDTANKSGVLVPIRSQGSRQAVYWLPGGGGLSVMAFRNLSYRLGLARPVFGLEAELDLGRAPKTLPDLAKNYMQAIIQQQAHGPYHLFGFSLGSFVAYELARQLWASGREVGMLVVFDTGVPSLMRNSERLRLLIHRTWRKIFAMDPAMALKSRQMSHENLIQKNTVFDEICRRNINAIYDYAANDLPHYDGKMICVLARQSNFWNIPFQVDPRLAWRRAARGGVEAIEVEGDHLSMLERPYVDKLGAILTQRLRDYEVKQKS